MFEINYRIEDAGWAVITIIYNYKTYKIFCSYLHDSLSDFANSGIQIQNKSSFKIVFMDEPGEHWLVLNKNIDNQIEFEIRHYQHWASNNLKSVNDYKIVITGKTTLTKYINQVRNNLLNIYTELGVEGYKQKWIKHDFPLQQLNILK